MNTATMTTGAKVLAETTDRGEIIITLTAHLGPVTRHEVAGMLLTAANANRRNNCGKLEDGSVWVAVPMAARAAVWNELNERLPGYKLAAGGKLTLLELPRKRCTDCGQMMCPDRCCCGC